MNQSQQHSAPSEPDPVSRSILDHDRLMTPRLIAMFGKIYARQTDSQDTPETYTRVSSMFTQDGDIHLLDARMEIIKNTVPERILDTLRTTGIPFGQLLNDFDISAKSENRQLFHRRDPETGDLRWGRRHIIVDTMSGRTLCRIEELLVPAGKLPRVKTDS